MKENRIYLVTPEEMRAYDTYTIEHIGIPALVLMERAALAVEARVEQALDGRRGKVLCVCGGGNNGGDGWRFPDCWRIRALLWIRFS